MTRKWLQNSIIKRGMLFMILCFLSSRSSAQNDQLPKGMTKGAIQYSPNGLLDAVQDYMGNKYTLGQIAIDNQTRKFAGETPLLNGEQTLPMAKRRSPAPGTAKSTHPFAPTTISSCTPGYFQLYLEAGCGMDDPSNPADVARLAVMCQVLTDISNFIPSPCTSTGQKVNIWVQAAPAGAGFLGEATPFFSMPYSTTASGIVDNMIWITINSGKDAWTNVTSPLYSSGSYSSFYHGAVAFQFDGSVNWHTSLTTPPAAGEYDLYTVALHEMMHAMGFHTLINYNGNTIFNPGFSYYSRYDQFLQTSSGTPLLTHSGSCSVYDWQFNPGLSPFPALSPGWTSSACPSGYSTAPEVDHTACSTANKYVDGSMTIPVYSPSCYEGGASLSHFEDECYAPSGFPLTPPASNNQYFVMSNAGPMGPYSSTTNPGAMKRYPQPEERQVLCDIGYQVNSAYGSSTYLNAESYSGGTCPGLQVAGINDGIGSGGVYTYYTSGTTPVDINAGTSGTSLLANDYGAASFKCLEVVNGTGTLSATSGTAGTLVSFTPGTGPIGVQLLRYIPVSGTGAEGNITYVYVYVGEPNCTPTACDLVSNGGFEMAVPGAFGDIVANPGISYCWTGYIGTPDLCTRNPSFPGWGMDIPLMYTIPPTDVHFPGTSTLHPNDHFMDMDCGYGAGATWEGMQSPLTSTLTTGTTYVMSCWAKVEHSSFWAFLPSHLIFAVSPSIAPLVPISGTTPPAMPSGITAIWDLTVDAIPGSYDWKYYTTTFTYSGPNANRLCVFQAPFLNSWPIGSAVINTIVDDISIQPVTGLPTFSLPAAICIPSPVIDLNTLVSIPGGTFTWATVSGGVVVTSHSNLFDPTLAYNASILGGGTGVVSVCYEYTNNLGCVVDVCANVTISNGTAAPITGPTTVCIGNTATLSDATPGGTWSSSNILIATVGTSTGVVTGIALGTVVITYTASCGSTTTTMTVVPGPSLYTVTGGGTTCIGGSGVHIGLSGSSTGVNYQLWLGGTAIGSPLPGTGSPLDFGAFTTAGTYTVVATDATTGCTTTMTGNAVIINSPGPTAYVVTGGGSYCAGGAGVHVGLGNSAVGVNYQLFIGGAPGPVLPGTGSPLDFGLQTTIGTYTIIATDATTGCTSTMTGSVSVSNYPSPTQYKVTGGGNMCVGDPGLHIYLSGSDIGVNYQLYCSGTPIGAPVAGTGATLDFGLQSSGCLYTVVATNTTTGCTIAMLGSATINVYPVPAPITGPGLVCVGGSASLADATPGGAWSSGNPLVATVGAGTGVVHGVAIGTAVITYTSPGGCYVTFTMAVGTNPIVGPSTVCVGSTVTLSDASPGGVWSSSDITVATVTSTGVVTGVGPGTVTIFYKTDCGTVSWKMTVIHPHSDCVCTYAAAGNSFTELGASGFITGGFYTGNYYVDHPVTVTGAVTLYNCVIVMAPGISMTVSSGAQLTVMGSHLFACYPNMWKGIVLSTAIAGGGTGPTGQLQLFGSNYATSMIEDAQIAVDIQLPVEMPGYTPGTGSTSALTLYANGCTFNKNMTGIRILDYHTNMAITAPTDMTPSYPFLVENSVFTCRDFYAFTDIISGAVWPFAWPSTIGFPNALKNPVATTTPYLPPYLLDAGYTKTVCNNGILSRIGVDLERVGFESGSVGSEVYSSVALGGGTPSSPNDYVLYDNMNYGVMAHNSNLLTRNSGFMNLFATPIGGDGIYAFNDDHRLDMLYVYGDFSGSYTNTFWNNVTCVEASEFYNVLGLHAIMSSQHSSADLTDPQGQYGYKVSSSNYYQEQINYNNIFNIAAGVDVSTNVPGSGGTQYIGQSTIDYNRIGAAKPLGSIPTLGEYARQAINVTNLPTPVGGGIFHGSQQNVDHNLVYGAYNGISVLNSNTANATQYITTNYNQVIALTPDPTLSLGSANQTGITHKLTLWDYIDNNYVTGSGYNTPAPSSSSSSTYYYTPMIEGIHVENVSTTGLYIGCNTTNDCNTGFYFGGHNTGIYWYNNTMTNDAYGYALDGDIGVQAGGLQTTGNQWLTTGSFSWLSDGWQTYTIGATDAALSLMYVHSSITNQEPFNNFGESSLMYNYGSSYGINHATPHPAPSCTYPVASSVPVAMRPGGGGDNDEQVGQIVNDQGNLAIIPNPNSGTFTIKGYIPEMANSKTVTLEVIDVLGRTLFSEPYAIEHGAIDKKVVMGDNIANGVYFVKLKDNATSKVLRFSLVR